MSMKNAQAPRRVYLRSGLPLVCFGGLYFGPGAKAGAKTKITDSKMVRIEVLPRNHGKARIQVTQGDVVETWPEAHVVFQSRS